MLMPNIEELLLERFVDWIAQVNARDFRSSQEELPHDDAARILLQGSGGRFHELFPVLF